MRCLIISILNSFTAFDVNWNAQLFNSTTENDKVNVEIALKNGVKPSATDQYGYTTLMLAALKGNQELAELLIEKGANINAKKYISLYSP